MQIDIGCGNRKPQNGFIGCDVRKNDHVEIVCNSWEIDKYVKKGTVKNIYSRHTFEHLTFEQGRCSLLCWHKCLSKGGQVRIIVPDLHYHTMQYLENYNSRDVIKTEKVFTEYTHSIAGFYGWQREKDEDDRYFSAFNTNWDIHKSGYDNISLKKLIESAGFVNYERLTNKPWHLDVQFYK
jgi:predicted SAM-dependent methyltransferase